ncbi:MAG: permease prefix domain 1-containing protein [Acidobacteria bacterium]|nr:permease prefix domain 1-containing protein [Acidobacteriota bacterium]
MVTHDETLEAQISQWRNWLRRRPAIDEADVEELEGHLRDVVAALRERGLAADEAFLVAVKRMGNLDAVSREFAREHSERLWKQLVMPAVADGAAARAASRETWVVLALAFAAAVAIKLPELFGYPQIGSGEGFFDNRLLYFPNVSFFVLPFLAGYFAWKRRLNRAGCVRLALAFAVGGVAINAFPSAPPGHTLTLAALHLPIALWLVVGIAYTGGRWREGSGRMDFVRFSGELFIYYVLIALGGGVLMAFTSLAFDAIGADVNELVLQWLFPCGAMGAVIVAAWLVEAKQSVVENMAPVLTRLFTPLFAAVLLAFLATMVWTGRGVDVEREVLIAFDLLLALVLGLLLYAVSARDPQAPRGLFDGVQLLLIVCALVVDIVALAAIAGRISEFGLSPNKVAALGENLVLLVNLSWSAWLYGRFLAGRGPFSALVRWQTAYLPVYAAWAAFVVLVFPPLFGFK